MVWIRPYDILLKNQRIKYIQKYNKCILQKCNNLNSKQFEILAVLVKTTDNVLTQYMYQRSPYNLSYFTIIF